MFLGFCVVIFHTPQLVGIICRPFGNSHQNGLIAHDTCGLVYRRGIQLLAFSIRLGPDDEERWRSVGDMEPGEIQKATIHDVAGARFSREQVHSVDFVKFAVADVNKSRDTASQIQQGMKTHGTFSFSEMSPREDGQTQVDSRCIQSIDRVFLFYRHRFFLVKLSGHGDQMMGKIDVDAPIPCFVRFRKGAAGSLRCPVGFHGTTIARRPLFGTDPYR